MNAKQLAALVLILGIVLLVQLGLSLRNQATVSAAEAEATSVELTKLRTQLEAEKRIYGDNEKNSKELLEYIKLWEPFFELIDRQQAVESFLSLKVREYDILNLSQRYEQVSHTINNKANDSLPVLVRGSLVFDDEYTKLINWTGMMESIRPTMRVSRLALSRGSRESGIRMDLTLEIPLWKKAQ
jgi:hypothetical protein